MMNCSVYRKTPVPVALSIEVLDEGTVVGEILVENRGMLLTWALLTASISVLKGASSP
jgi:hypothetical protein